MNLVFNTSKGKIILHQLAEQGLSKKQMQPFVIACLQRNLDADLHSSLKQNLKIQHDSSGRPFLIGENAPNISISYAKNWVAIYLSNTEIVGIDIEFGSRKILKIVNLFVNDAEKNNFPVLTLEILHLIWGAKEAIFKLHGGAMADLKNEVEITKINFEEKTIDTKSHFGNTLCHFKILGSGMYIVSC